MKTTSSAPDRQKPDMQYLTKPRGKGYALRMVTPDVLIGTENPWTGNPFGKEIKLGLKTQRHSEAIRTRDIRLGQVRQLEADALASKGRKGVGRIIDLSPENAAEWRQMREEASDPDAIDYVLSDKLQRAEDAGFAKEARSFGKVVFRGAIPLDQALEQYLLERSDGNPFGFDPLARTTALDVRSTMKHLRDFLGDPNPTLHHVTPEKVFAFRTHYLPVTIGLKPQTVAKHLTLMRGLWSWAITDKRFLRSKNGKPIPNPWIIDASGTPRKKATQPKSDEKRTAFTPGQVGTLLRGFPNWGSRQGDLLRLALVTGCRVDEIGSLLLSQVKSNGSSFSILQGKTANAVRFVPVVEEAQRLLVKRHIAALQMQLEVSEAEQRLFPEWPLKPSTGKVNSASQWFTRYRRQVLGDETDGTLAMHSFRHTWRTVARRAGVAEDRIRELGGWEGKRDTADNYDHGLLEDDLQGVQRAPCVRGVVRCSTFPLFFRWAG